MCEKRPAQVSKVKRDLHRCSEETCVLQARDRDRLRALHTFLSVSLAPAI